MCCRPRVAAHVLPPTRRRPRVAAHACARCIPPNRQAAKEKPSCSHHLLCMENGRLHIERREARQTMRVELERIGRLATEGLTERLQTQPQHRGVMVVQQDADDSDACCVVFEKEPGGVSDAAITTTTDATNAINKPTIAPRHFQIFGMAGRSSVAGSSGASGAGSAQGLSARVVIGVQQPGTSISEQQPASEVPGRRCGRLPARVIGICIDASAPKEKALAFNAIEAASSPDPLAAVSTEAAKGARSDSDPTPPARVSAGSVGLPKTLTLAGKVSRWREHREGWLQLSSSTAEPASPSMCGGGRGEKRGDLRAEPSLVDAQEDPMVAIQRSI